jgi:hypothetical protein
MNVLHTRVNLQAAREVIGGVSEKVAPEVALDIVQTTKNHTVRYHVRLSEDEVNSVGAMLKMKRGLIYEGAIDYRRQVTFIWYVLKVLLVSSESMGYIQQVKIYFKSTTR